MLWKKLAALKKLKRKWLSDESHHLEDGLVDLGKQHRILWKRPKYLLKEKNLKGECKKIVLNLLLFFMKSCH